MIRCVADSGGPASRYHSGPMTPQAWKKLGTFTQLCGRRIFFVEAGEGPGLLLLHAYPTASWGWHRMWPALTSRFRVIVPDLPGSGFSDKPTCRHYSVFHLADVTEALLKERGFDSLHVFAHAYGVTTAQELLARHVDRVEHAQEAADPGFPRIETMAFVNGGLFPEATRPTLTQKILLTRLGGALARFAPRPQRMFRKKLVRNFGPDTQPSRADLDAIWELLTHNAGDRVVPDVLQYLKQRSAERDRWVGALQKTRVPLELINGAADPVSGVHVPEVWKQEVPDRPLVQLDAGIGHYPPLECPDALLKVYLAFVDRPRS